MIRETIPLGNSELVVEVGKLAKQATSSVFLTQGGTSVLVTLVRDKSEREGTDFLPLSVEYREFASAAGKIPGGYFKREGRPSEHEIISARLIDRSLRPLFPKTWRKELQVIATVFSADGQNDPATLGLSAAALCAHLSDVPFDGPLAGIRVGRIEGQFVVNPTREQAEQSDIEITMAASPDAIVMVEGGANFTKESDVVDALLFGHREAQKILSVFDKIRAEIGEPKQEHSPYELSQELKNELDARYSTATGELVKIKVKQDRHKAADKLVEDVKLAYGDEKYATDLPFIVEYVLHLIGKAMRAKLFTEGTRIDGRAPNEVRPIAIEVGLLSRTHGSALFTRGETQALVTATLGTRDDEQRIDSLNGDTFKRFMLHYNFPPFSTGEVKPLRGTSRREVGHGMLAERALKRVLPSQEKFEYTIRILSTILESNGSSSMATVCGGSLALMDAGVPVSSAIAGVAMGLVKEGEKVVILTDILGDEDHLGDMDFKIAGNREGITAVQMDIKIKGVERNVLVQALEEARKARLHILDKMDAVIDKPRPELSPYAPRIVTIQIPVDRIRDVIGPGGRVIRDITAKTNTAIFVEDDGKITIASPDMKATEKAIEIIRGLTASAELNKTYTGKVVKITDFGAFVEIIHGVEGLLHISEVANHRVRAMTDVMKEGDEVVVKVIEIDERTGKIRLSRKAALAEKGQKG